MSRSSLRKSLSAPGLLRAVRRCFQALKDDTVGRGFTLAEYLMSGLAVDGTGYFYSDRVQQHGCGLFRAALARQGRKRYFREKLRSFFFTWLLPDWETLYKVLAFGAPRSVIVPYDIS